MNTPYVFKKCSKCGRWLVASTVNFNKRKDGKYGLNSQCKECKRDYRAKWRAGIKSPRKKECPDGYKKCTKCGRVLPANTDNFYRTRNGKYGLKAECKECCDNSHKIYQKVYKEERKKYHEYYNKKYYKEHKEYRAEYNKIYYKTPQGQVVLFNNNNKRRLREEQQGTGITTDQWLEMMQFFEFKCAYSGITLNGNTRTVDHIVPLTKGGENEVWNCVPMNRGLNCSKHNSDIKEWYPQQNFYNEDRLNKINEWCEYAYNKWGKK